jgi:uncharacterized protein involved in exopolysaccharide biosynthesis/MinD-like ATPase involved in chromosome partitioning or flagellar assembly
MNRQLSPITGAALPIEYMPVGVEQSEFGRLNARDILNIFIRHQWLILSVVLIVTAVVTLKQLTEPRRYVAQSMTKIEVLPSNGGANVPQAERELRMQTQLRIMTSAGLSEVVVRDLGLHRNRDFMGDDFRRISNPKQEQEQIETATAKLQASIDVKRPQESQLISVEVGSATPELSGRIADQFPRALQEWDDAVRQKARDSALATLGPQLGQAEQELSAAERGLADARTRYRLLPGAGTEADLRQLNEITNEFVSARGVSAGASARAAGVARSGTGGLPSSAFSSPELGSLQRQYDDLARRKSELSVTYGDNYPELSAVNAQLSRIQGGIAEETTRARSTALAAASANAARESQLARSDASGAAARASTVGGYLNQLTGRAFQNVRSAAELASLERAIDAKRDAAKLIRARYQQALHFQGGGGIIASPLSAAQISATPANFAPNRTFIAGLIGSLVLGCLLAFAREMTDNRLRSSNQVKRKFGLKTLAMLPRVNEALLDQPSSNPVIRNPRSIFAEMARSLYTDVIHLGDRSRSQVIAITSALPKEGKSTVALSLAAAAKMVGKRAILVDLDLRRYGILQDMQRQSGGPDLTDYLTNKVRLDGLLTSGRTITVEDGVMTEEQPRLPAVLSIHQPLSDPGALIASAELDQFIARLREHFDFIVLNAPPLLAVKDAKILTRIADETLMVVRWGDTTFEEVEAGISTLDEAPAGVVFNDVDFAEHARRRYSDPIQFVARARDYYEDIDDLVRPAPVRFKAWLRRFIPAFART